MNLQTTSLRRKSEFSNYVVVTWSVNKICNYRCSYCPPELHSGGSAGTNLKAVQDLLRSISRQGKSIFLSILGGEPTFWPQFEKFLKFKADYPIYLEMLTNASHPADWWNEYVNFIDFLVLSYHWEFADQGHFEKVAAAVHGRVPVNINIMVKPGTAKKSHTLACFLHEKFPLFSIRLKPLRLNFGSQLYDYNDEELKLMKNNWNPDAAQSRPVVGIEEMVELFDDSGRLDNENLVSRVLGGKNNWQGWKCFAGIETLFIDSDGGVYRAGCKQGGKIGQLGEAVVLPKDPLTCNLNSCSCLNDISASKCNIEI